MLFSCPLLLFRGQFMFDILDYELPFGLLRHSGPRASITWPLEFSPVNGLDSSAQLRHRAQD